MLFGVYVHIPYCLQKCVYCDFATVETTSLISQIVPPTAYVDRVKNEIIHKGPTIGPRELDTLYFGGGTPSAIEPSLLVSIISQLGDSGFSLKPAAEVTLEINPGTLSEVQIEQLLKAGFNRFSVGAQTFDDDLLKMSHRKHSSDDTRDTLNALKKRKINFSLDVLFALPTQTKDGLSRDLDEALSFHPNHVSTYCLNVPAGHPFSHGAAPEGEQVEMFGIIEEKLQSAEIHRYEISNFAKPGFESRHNMLYWTDKEYWGIGNSAHSYIHTGQWGSRFWNPKGLSQYVSHVEQLRDWSISSFSAEEGEVLSKNQAMTDFVHTSLRLKKGLNPKAFEEKFDQDFNQVASQSIKKMRDQKLLEIVEGNFSLSPEGLLLSNIVFEEFTFLKSLHF
jgi:oxygen-independent coproporphyrinogen-3 oxidase